MHSVLARVAAETGRGQVTMSAEALRALLAYQWPGNLRQLINALRAAVALCEDDHIELLDLPVDVRETMPAPSGRALPAPAQQAACGEPDDERGMLLRELRKQRWNVTRAAQELGISRATIYRKMTRWRIVAPNAAGGD
jgi:transcriptional regulator of acetoin/glycerol metabolism